MSWPHALSILGQSLRLLRVRLDWNRSPGARPKAIAGDNSPSTSNQTRSRYGLVGNSSRLVAKGGPIRIAGRLAEQTRVPVKGPPLTDSSRETPFLPSTWLNPRNDAGTRRRTPNPPRARHGQTLRPWRRHALLAPAGTHAPRARRDERSELSGWRHSCEPGGQRGRWQRRSRPASNRVRRAPRRSPPS
jgi:hypothetical protein